METLVLQKDLLILMSKKLSYSEEILQNYNYPPICGHFCLFILEKLSRSDNYEEILKYFEVKDVYPIDKKGRKI